MIYNLPRKKRKRITNYLTFSSPNPFSISVATPGWNGKLYYSKDTKTWVKWTGNEVNATEADGTYALYFRGTSLTTAPSLPATTLANYCYSYMFNGCTSIKIPQSPINNIIKF